LQNGKQIRFWEDIWLGANALKDQYPNLYNIVRQKNATISNISSARPLNISFTRCLVGENLNSWHTLVLRISNIYYLNDQPNIFKWSLKANCQFLVSSMYQAMLDIDLVTHKIYQIW
jgi:hypothetical protein